MDPAQGQLDTAMGLHIGTPWDDRSSWGVVGNDEDDEIYGLGGDDILAGHGGDDYLDGGAGADTMGGGDGDDTYVVDQLGDVIVEENNHNGWDIVLCYSQNSHQLEAGVEELRLMEGAVNGGFGNQSRNVLRGNSAGNILAGEGGDDDLYGNDGDDELHGDDRTDPTIAGNDRLYGGAHNDTLKGGRGNDQLYGGSHGDSLFGGDDDDVLDGGTGGDAMRGEAGNDDYYVENALDQVIEGVDQGDDEVFSTISFTLGENVERLTLQHSGFVIDGTGNGGDNEINGNNSRNTLRGDGGNDHLFGNLDEDTLYGDEGEDELDGGSHDDKLYGGANDDRLYGRSGHDDLNGGSGDDRMEGGSGDDEYTVGSAGDTVVEHWNQGTDTVYAAVSHTLAANVENLILMEPLFQRGRGEAARNGTGNVLANTITGNDEDNTIDGGYGNDILTGGDGTDTVSFASWDADVPGQPGSHVVGIALGQGSAAGTAERISINSYAGTATVVESDQLFGFENVRGSNRYEHIAGNGGNNILEGRGGDDLLMGNGGNDTLDGGQGLDMASYENNGGMVMVWLCQNGADGSALEFANGQAAPLSGDTLRSIEMVRGSAFGDQITGNEGQNTLDGRGGADVMSGLTESDTYIVDNSLDVAAEGVGQGTLDTVRTHVSYALTANSEIEVLETMNQSGTAALNLAGNNFGNTITGNNGANRISGGIDPVYDGQDVLTGRGGADTFVWSSVNQTQLAGQTADVVMDFNRAEGDLLDFTAIDAIANGGTANDDFTFAGVVNVAANQGFTGVGQIGYFTTGTDTFILLNTEVDAGIDFQDATIHIIGGHTVDASWFV
jgi:trimeric autotransporter adhesin